MNLLTRCYELVKDYYTYNFSSAPPNQLILFVTSHCNFKCETCFYWENLNDTDNDLTLEEIKKISTHFNGLRLLLLSGGEPFLRKDLFEVIKVFYENNHVRKLHLPTNGYATEKIIATTEKLLMELPDLKINMGISLDAFGEKHDEIKKQNGAFAKAIETQHALVELEKKYNILKTSFYCVVSSDNIEETEKLFQFIAREFGYEKIGFSPLRGDPKDGSLSEPSQNDWENIFQMYRKYIQNNPFQMKQFFINRKMEFVNRIYGNVLSGKGLSSIQCSAGKNICVIDANGDVRACELKGTIANIRDYDYDITKIVDKKEKHTCSCTHACFLNASLEISPFNYVRSWLNL